ncbi:hypothetical protein, partial [Pseudomonas amygdali]|uniref:hypothetical protein n=1 Tax=Pseudomonas amygdali TaxID=47877 RepID=UPI00195847C6
MDLILMGQCQVGSRVNSASAATGYWLKAHGVDAEFDILLKTPHLSETEVHTLLANHQENLCWLAYKNSHENPYYPHQLESGVIATPILLDDI